jgi:hypothetical protein
MRATRCWFCAACQQHSPRLRTESLLYGYAKYEILFELLDPAHIPRMLAAQFNEM